jgi:nicotinamidase-related amidase
MNQAGYRMQRAASALLVIDVQQRLAPAIEDGRTVIANCVWLMQLAQRMGVPTVVTEHCADKIGGSLEAILDAADGVQVVGKRLFSASADGCLAATALSRCEDVIVCGTETHVCVQQTALDLAHAGKRVFVVADAVGSRHRLDRDLAIERMRSHGIAIVTREMVAFEWLESGDDPLFGEINREFLR